MRSITHKNISAIESITQASMVLTDLAPAMKIFADRCGQEANLVICGIWLSSIEPILWGQGLGHLKIFLEPAHSDTKSSLLAFRVAFRAVDELAFEPLSPYLITNLPADLELLDQVIALATIHESAKASLDSDYFEEAMKMMAKIDIAAITKLKE